MASNVFNEFAGQTPVRRWPRYKLDIPIRLVVPQEDGLRVFAGRGRELNEGGLAVFVGRDIALDTWCFVEFTSPYSSEPLRVRSIVRDRTGYSYGLEFVDEPDHIDRFRDLLRAFSKQ